MFLVRSRIRSSADLGLGPRQRRARAAVHAAAEGDVTPGVRAFDVERGGILELPWIAVGRAVHHHHRGARGHVNAADRHVAPRQPEVALHRALDAQALFDEVGDLGTLGAQPLLQFGILREHLQRGAQQPDRGLLPGGVRLAAIRATSITSGVEPSGNVAPPISVSASARGSRRRSSM